MAATIFARLAPSHHELREIEGFSRDQLLGIAVARGCRHYASFADSPNKVDEPSISHEVLGCALLRGPRNIETFRAIRVAAMVLSDEGNSPDEIGSAAVAFQVEGRVSHIAKLALKADNRPDFWNAVLASLPSMDDVSEVSFLPGISRLRSETQMTGLGRGRSLVWLRTAYAR
ncbi:MAG: hypothetical protein WC661_02240 [Opitutaceae bacterium]|jgi:hypothetical protein